MIRSEIIDLFGSSKVPRALRETCARASGLLAHAAEPEIVRSEDRFPAEHFREILERRCARLDEMNESLAGLRATVDSLRQCHSDLRAGFAETDQAGIQFWIDDDDIVRGCVIATKPAHL